LAKTEKEPIMSVPGDVPREAILTLNTYLSAFLRHDEAAMRACVARQTLESDQMRNDAPEGFTFALGEAKMEGENAIIPMALTPLGATEPAMQMECLLTLEDGAWKVDLVAALERMMRGPMAAAMEDVTAGMAQAMEGVGHAMAEAFGPTTTGEIGVGDQDWSGASLEVQEDEFLPMPAMTPLPKTTEAVRYALGADCPVTAAIGDLLQTLGSDETDVLVAWFEDTLFAGLGQILKAVAAEMPLQGRLHAIRIEAAGWIEDRFVALDGSDLVYRMFPANQEGYYSDEELRMILMGVLAGLPAEVDERSAGRRTLANDTDTEFVPTMGAYKERHVPRFMRRIGEVLGRRIRLEVDWDDMNLMGYMGDRAGRLMVRWCMSRIFGAVSLICLEPERGTLLRNEMKAIKLVFGTRYARYADGTLEVGLTWVHAEKGCFYEYEIAGAGMGRPVGELPNEV
jgi:hypothetical protein